MVTDQRLKDLHEIAIVIDTWDDIFSDFDPRPLNVRTVSGDFVEELKKRYSETTRGKFLINVYAPIQLQNKESEKMVRQRLKKHFNYIALLEQKTLGKIWRRGVIFIVVGTLALTVLTLITYFRFFNALTIELISIILMPLGWFGIWEGFSKLVDTSPHLQQSIDIFTKLSKASYQFHYIEKQQTK